MAREDGQPALVQQLVPVEAEEAPGLESLDLSEVVAAEEELAAEAPVLAAVLAIASPTAETSSVVRPSWSTASFGRQPHRRPSTSAEAADRHRNDNWEVVDDTARSCHDWMAATAAAGCGC